MREQPSPAPALPGLLDLVAQGDQHAASQVYDATCRLAYGLALRILDRPQLAERALVEAYEAVFREAASGSRAADPLAWILSQVRREALALRGARTAPLPAPPAAPEIATLRPGGASPALASTGERGNRIRRALEKLPAAQRATLEAAFFQGLTQGEIARVRQTSIAAIAAELRAGLEAIRAALGSQGGPP